MCAGVHIGHDIRLSRRNLLVILNRQLDAERRIVHAFIGIAPIVSVRMAVGLIVRVRRGDGFAFHAKRREVKVRRLALMPVNEHIRAAEDAQHKQRDERRHDHDPKHIAATTPDRRWK